MEPEASFQNCGGIARLIELEVGETRDMDIVLGGGFELETQLFWCMPSPAEDNIPSKKWSSCSNIEP